MTVNLLIANQKKAYQLYDSGLSPSYSTGICECITAGYGELDEVGYFEFPLEVNQETYKIIPINCLLI